MGKRKKQANSKKQIKIVLTIVAVSLIVGFFVYGYITFNKQYLSDLRKIENAKAEIERVFPTEVDNNLNFDSFLSDYKNLNITFNSNNKEVIDEEGQVYRPSYLSNDVEVELEVIIEIVVGDPLKKLYYSFFGEISDSFKITVKVIKREATGLEKLDLIASQIYVPEITKGDLGLQTDIHLFEDATISWSTSDANIITSAGKVVSTGHATLTATINLDSGLRTLMFPIDVVSDYVEITEIDENFNSVTTNGTYDTAYNISDLIINGAVINADNADKFLRMRAHGGATIDFKNSYSGLNYLSFTYYAITSSAFTNDVYINVQSSNDGVTWSNVKDIKIVDNDTHNENIDLSGLPNNSKIRISSSANYATMFVAIDNIKLTRDVNGQDVRRELEKILPKSLSTSYILPMSTPFGGSITWDSSDITLLTNSGVVSQPNETKAVVLTATIQGILDTFDLEFYINILGTNYVTPVEVFFIDLGKYGDADNGESIYFKIGDVDVLVDAGDNMTATKQAISEIIDANSEDKVLDYVIATHPDADHIGSMKHIYDTYDVLNAIYFEGDHTTQLYQSFVTSVANEALVSECTVLQAYNNVDGCSRVIELAPNVNIEFYNTGYYETDETNGRSIVFVLEAYGTRLLMTGDADNGSGRTLESNYMNSIGDVDILKVVHHGTREGTTLEFLEAVDPEVAIITNGNYFGNKHGHPTFEAINRIYQYDNKIGIFAVVGGNVDECTYTTSYKCEVTDRFVDRNGTITLNIDASGYTFNSEYNDEMIELSSTEFWKTHPYKEYEYAK